MEYVERANGIYGEATKDLEMTFIREKQGTHWKYVVSKDEPKSPRPMLKSVVLKPNNREGDPGPGRREIYHQCR